jgi:hypothetical protein
MGSTLHRRSPHILFPQRQGVKGSLVTIPTVLNNERSGSVIRILNQGAQGDLVNILSIDLPVGSTLRIRWADDVGNVDDGHGIPR